MRLDTAGVGRSPTRGNEGLAARRALAPLPTLWAWMLPLLAFFLGWPPSPLPAAPGQDLGLIMIQDPACRFCRKWEAEVGKTYAQTAAGRAAPLLRVTRGAAQIASFAPVVYTPTFILVRGGREIGRIVGYPGKSYFYEELEALLSRANEAPAPQRERNDAFIEEAGVEDLGGASTAVP